MITAWLLSVLLLSASAPCEPAVCRCLPYTPGEAGERADAIFTATVVAVADPPQGNTGGPPRGRGVRLRVDAAWKGVESPDVLVIDGRTSCDIRWTPGERMLVYGRRGPDGELRAGHCTGTRSVHHAAGFLESLGAPARTWGESAPPGSR
ncbi:MAG TPA: hypothetical protein VF142_23320 [Longimicrobium sp.]